MIDYFRWRSEDANRNALNAHCYWALRRKGDDVATATQQVAGLNVAQKNELLFQEAKLNFNNLPTWQKRGTGLYWQTSEIEGYNPKTQQPTKTSRRSINVDMNLPMKDNYDRFIAALLDDL